MVLRNATLLQLTSSMARSSKIVFHHSITVVKKLEDIVPSFYNCDVTHVNRTDYQLIDISEDRFVSLLTETGGTKDDLRLPTDETLLAQIKDAFAEGKDLVVMSSMGEDQICALKDIGPK